MFSLHNNYVNLRYIYTSVLSMKTQCYITKISFQSSTVNCYNTARSLCEEINSHSCRYMLYYVNLNFTPIAA